MNVSLPTELERFVQAKVGSGRYGSASEVIREALRLLEHQERFREKGIKEIRRKIAEGLKSLDRGQGLPGEAVFAELEAGLGRRKQGRKAG